MSEDNQSEVVEPEKLYPFPINSPLTTKAMDILGISVEEIKPVSLNELIKLEKNRTFAQKKYEVLCQQRTELLKQINEEREKIKNETKNSLKMDPTVNRVKLMTEMNTKITENKDKTNTAILKRLAINEIRQNKRKQKIEAHNQKVDDLTFAHTQKVNSYPIYTATYHEISRRDQPFDLKKSEAATENMNKHIERYKERMEEERQRLKQVREEEQNKATKVITKSEQLLEQKKEKTMKKIDSLEHNKLLSEEQLQLRQKDAADRYQKVLQLGEEKRKKADDIVNARTTRQINKLTARIKKSEETLGQTAKERQQKIQDERARLERMTAAANAIFAKQVENREKYRQFLNERDEKVEDYVHTFKESRDEELFDRSLRFNIKTAQVKRRAHSRQAQTMLNLERKANRDLSMLSKATTERCKSESSKTLAEENFNAKRKNIKDISYLLDGKTEQQQIDIIMKMIGISREEAVEVLDTAQKPF